MVKVCYNNEVIDARDLAHAIELAKELAVFVTICGDDYELCGVFGTAGIENGILPDGSEYQWKKRRI